MASTIIPPQSTPSPAATNLPAPPSLPVGPPRGAGGNPDAASEYLRQRMSGQIPAPGATPAPAPAVAPTPASQQAPAALTADPAPSSSPGTTTAAPAGDPNPPAGPQTTTPAAPAAPAQPDLNLSEFDFDSPDTPTPSTTSTSPASPTSPGTPSTTSAPVDPSTPPPPEGTPDVVEAMAAVERLVASGKVKDIEQLMLVNSRGRRVLQTFKAMRELEAPPNADGTGGIGAIPTVDEIKAGYYARQNWEAFQHDLEYNPQSVLLHVLDYDPAKGQFSPRAEQIIQELIPIVQDTPHLLQAIAQPVLRQSADQLYAFANSIPPGQNPDSAGVDERTRAFDAAKIFESRFFGRVRTGTAPVSTTPPASGAPATSSAPSGQPDPNDPLAEERRRLDRQARELAAREQRLNETRIHAFNDAVFTDTQSGILADIDNLAKAAGVRDAFPSDQLYNLWRSNFLNEVLQTVSGDQNSGKSPYNPVGFQDFKRRLQSGGQLATRSTLEALATQRKQTAELYRQLARPVIRMLAPQHVSVAGKRIQTQAIPPNAAHLATQGPGQVEPAGGTGGAPPPRSVVPATPQFTVQPGESREDAFKRHIASRMAATGLTR
jgi:hypothetical protein